MIQFEMHNFAFALREMSLIMELGYSLTLLVHSLPLSSSHKMAPSDAILL